MKPHSPSKPSCKSCRWWTPNKEDEWCYDGIIKPENDDGELMPVEFEVRRCKSPHLLFYERPVNRTDACVVDGSEYKAELITGPDYGCPNHEAS